MSGSSVLAGMGGAAVWLRPPQPNPRTLLVSPLRQRTVRGLLVGIDRYVSPVPKLSGCVNDVRSFESYLNAQAAGTEACILTLCNEHATRDAIIAGFREHLIKTEAGDVALFCYARHGSQEQLPPEFWHLEPDRLDETLVCYDSRSPGGHDLADKELAQLVDEVAAGGAHVVVILDCCHSGSGTRNTDLQSTAPRQSAPGWERGLQPRWQDPRRRILCLRPRWRHRRCGSVGRRSLLPSSTRRSDRQPQLHLGRMASVFPHEPYRRTFRELPWPSDLPEAKRSQAEQEEKKLPSDEDSLRNAQAAAIPPPGPARRQSGRVNRHAEKISIT